MGYRLKDDGYAFKKIMQGRKWVGRVYQTADGKWSADINRQTYASGYATAKEAFYEGAARRMGFESHDHLREQNSLVRRANKLRRQESLARFAKEFPVLAQYMGRRR